MTGCISRLISIKCWEFQKMTFSSDCCSPERWFFCNRGKINSALSRRPVYQVTYSSQLGPSVTAAAAYTIFPAKGHSHKLKLSCHLTMQTSCTGKLTCAQNALLQCFHSDPDCSILQLYMKELMCHTRSRSSLWTTSMSLMLVSYFLRK